jgi:hypothetical protein
MYVHSSQTLIILGAWTLWRHVMTVFNGSSPHLVTAIVMEGEEVAAWGMAGAKGLAMLTGLDVAVGG